MFGGFLKQEFLIETTFFFFALVEQNASLQLDREHEFEITAPILPQNETLVPVCSLCLWSLSRPVSHEHPINIIFPRYSSIFLLMWCENTACAFAGLIQALEKP